MINSKNIVTKLCDSINKTAFFVVYKGNVLISYGDYSRIFYCASVRISFTSALTSRAMYMRHNENLKELLLFEYENKKEYLPFILKIE